MKKDIGELLVDNGQITEKELEQAIREAQQSGLPLGRALLRLGFITEDTLKTVLELNYGVNYVDLKRINPDPSLIMLLPASLLCDYEVVPVQRAGSRLTIAMVNPTDSEALSRLQENLKDQQLYVVVCSDDGFHDFLSRANIPTRKVQQGDNQVELIELVDGDAAVIEDYLGGAVAENRAMILLSNHILSNAISKGCTNIHIEPNDRQVLVHYRKEGVLFPARKLPKAILPDLVQRFKFMAARDAQNVSLPYDGLLNVRQGSQNFAFRLSIISGAYGEHLVIWLE